MLQRRSHNRDNFPYFSIKTYALTHQKIRLTETVLTRGHNDVIMRIKPLYLLLSPKTHFVWFSELLQRLLVTDFISQFYPILVICPFMVAASAMGIYMFHEKGLYCKCKIKIEWLKANDQSTQGTCDITNLPNVVQTSWMFGQRWVDFYWCGLLIGKYLCHVVCSCHQVRRRKNKKEKHQQGPWGGFRPRGYKTFFMLHEIFLLINDKMPTIVGILTFMSRKNSILGLSESEESWIWYFYTYEHLKFHAQLSWAWKKFYNLGAWFAVVGLWCFHLKSKTVGWSFTASSGPI